MYIGNPENLTPGVNQFPHCHSTETETHIHFCPKSAETFDLLSFFRQQSDCLHVHCHRELIYRPPLHKFIPIPAQIFQIPCQCRRITTHIHNPLRLHIHHRSEQRFLAALPRWVYDDHIGMRLLPRMFPRIFRIILWQHFLCLSYIKFRILYSVNLRIIPGILNRLRHNLYTIYLLCFLR